MTDDDSGFQIPRPLQDAIDSYSAWRSGYWKSEEAANKITEPLYHYTDAAGLRGIFESKQIWLTDYRHLNDTSELLHGMETIRDVARRHKVGTDCRAQLFLDCFIDMFSSESFNETFEFYVGSFSRKRDDLGQWRAYADNGRGFAIGFAPRLFGNDVPPVNTLDHFVGPVTYTPEGLDALCTQPITKAAKAFLLAANANADLMNDRRIGIAFMQQMVREMIPLMIWRSLTAKHPAYDNEGEVRLVILGALEKVLPFVKTRLRGSEIVPYIPLPWDTQKSGNVVDIMIGPAAPPDTERTLRKFLSTLGMDFDDIDRSDIPYRAV